MCKRTHMHMYTDTPHIHTHFFHNPIFFYPCWEKLRILRDCCAQDLETSNPDRSHREVKDTLKSAFGFCVFGKGWLLSSLGGWRIVKCAYFSSLIVGMDLGLRDRTLTSASGCGWQSHQGIFVHLASSRALKERSERQLSMSLAYAHIPNSVLNRMFCLRVYVY